MSLRPIEKKNVRRRLFKVGVDEEEGRRRRDDYLVEIRKNKREETLMKKRYDVDKELPPNSEDPFKTSLDISNLIAGVFSNDPSLQLEATTRLRVILSLEVCPSIDAVIQSGVVPRFVEFLRKNNHPKLQIEAACALANISSGASEHTKELIAHEAVPIFVQLLPSHNYDVRAKVIWGLGRVACASIKCRDFVHNCGALMPLLHQLNEPATLPILKNAARTLSIFFLGKPSPPFDLVKPALPTLERLVLSNDEDVFIGACWALSYLSDNSNEIIQSVIEAGVLPRLVELIKRPSPAALAPALGTIANIIAGNHQQTQCVINCGALPALADLLTQRHTIAVRREACWAISNITAGNGNQIQLVIDANLIPTLVNLAQHAEFDIKKEAVYAISNATEGASPSQIKYLVDQNCIKPLCDILVCSDLVSILVGLSGLENILMAGEVNKIIRGVNYYSQMIEDAEGVAKIERLQHHDNNDISENAVKILQTYWHHDEGL